MKKMRKGICFTVALLIVISGVLPQERACAARRNNKAQQTRQVQQTQQVRPDAFPKEFPKELRDVRLTPLDLKLRMDERLYSQGFNLTNTQTEDPEVFNPLMSSSEEAYDELEEEKNSSSNNEEESEIASNETESQSLATYKINKDVRIIHVSRNELEELKRKGLVSLPVPTGVPPQILGQNRFNTQVTTERPVAEPLMGPQLTTMPEVQISKDLANSIDNINNVNNAGEVNIGQNLPYQGYTGSPLESSQSFMSPQLSQQAQSFGVPKYTIYETHSNAPYQPVNPAMSGGTSQFGY